MGVHFALDMLGAVRWRRWGWLWSGAGDLLHDRIYPALDALYQVILQRAHLPHSLFPRAVRSKPF